MSVSTSPRFLSVYETARYFRQSEETIRRKIRAGEIEAVRLGVHGPLRVPADALEQHLRPAYEPRRASVATTANGRSSPHPRVTREVAA
jgi:excisionase family DNA binding protein